MLRKSFSLRRYFLTLALAITAASALLYAEPADKDPVSDSAKPEVKIEKPSEPAAAPEKSVAPEAASAPETPKTQPSAQPAGATPTAATPAKLTGCLAPLGTLIEFHNKEVQGLKKFIARWQGQVDSVSTRRKSVDDEIRATEKDLDNANGKKEKERFKNQLSRLKKNRGVIDKEMKSLCKDLAAELRGVGKDASAVLSERFREVEEQIKKSGEDRDN